MKVTFDAFEILIKKSLFVNQNLQGSICETRTGPNRPQTRRGMGFFVDLKYIFYENRYFWPI